MRLELIAGTENVFCFPKRRRERPTVQLLGALRSDVREIDLIAEAFGLDQPGVALKDEADRCMADYIAANVPAAPVEARDLALDALRICALVTAIDACRAMEAMDRQVMDAQTKVAEAQNRGSYQAVYLQEVVEDARQRAAEATLLAHVRSEEAMGVARAVDIAMRGEVWTPYDPHAEAAALFGFSLSA